MMESKSETELATPQAVLPGEDLEPLAGLGLGRAFFILFSYCVLQMLVGIVVGGVAGVYYGITRGAATPEIIAEAQRVVMVPAALAGTLLGELAALWLTRHSLPGSLRSGALRPIGWLAATRRDLCIAAISGIGLSFVYLFLLVPTHPPAPDQAWGPLVSVVQWGGWPRHAWALLALLVAPPIEEFVFRGVLFAGISRSWGPALGGVVVTLLFIVAHALDIHGYWPAWISIALVGAATMLFRIRANSLLPPILVHACYNLGLVLAVYGGAA
jgi:membrane protease YdiL (CAAX protease family)